MMALARSVAPLFPVLVTVAVTLAACGTDGGTATELDLTPAGEAGREVALSKGCASCHGQDGEGGVGPAFTGVFGSTVELDDADPVVADEAYIIESITDPRAKRVDGYSLPMPQVDLSDDEIASIVAYIRELGTPAGTVAP
jgi:cytochrome c oxidase subunit 2